jgi:2-polyprenyl-6-methoxyphenol hydroxylase-like FAD-dependent oxidoreductase
MPDSPATIFERLSTHASPTDTVVHFRTAHVLGGGIAGLLAARVLADHGERVVIVEPDGPQAGADVQTRPGVPQGNQVHTLLPGGRAQLERWFPGFSRQALDEGAVLARPEESVVHLDEVEEVTTPNSVLLCSSRPFLESLVRRRTLALPNVEVVTGRATGLDYARDAVAAVRYTTGTAETVEPTDFVVDATGRSSRLSDWLEHGGWPAPQMDRLQVDVRYLTARFRRSHRSGPRGAISRYSPGFPSKGLAVAALNAVEDDQWMLMLAYFGSAGERLTTEDFLARCRDLQPLYREVVAGELIGDVVPYRHPDSRWRHFETLDRFPARLAVVGDAVASFNPVYGQGMSSAALHASCLSEYLRSQPDLDAPARHFLALQQVVVDAAWQLSTGADAARLGVLPEPATEEERQAAWAVQQVMAASVHDVEVATAFRAVGFMTAHPATLGAPDLVRRAVEVNERTAKGGPATTPLSETEPTETVLDRYIGLADRAVHDPALLAKELPSIFAPDATVQLFDEPVTGFDAILAFYRAHIATQADCRHFWNTRVLDDGTLEAEWVAAGRMADGSLLAVGGVETATLDAAGLISHLRNRPAPAPS